MSVDAWLASAGAAWLVPWCVVLGLVSTALRERDVGADGTVDSGLGRPVAGDTGQPVRWVSGLARWRRIVVSLLAISVCVLLVSAAVRFAVYT